MSEHPRQELAPGLTYRQLDYWTRLGLIVPDNGACPGSGRPRRWSRWSEGEMSVARRMGVLRLQGYELATAEKIARSDHDEAYQAWESAFAWQGFTP